MGQSSRLTFLDTNSVWIEAEDILGTEKLALAVQIGRTIVTLMDTPLEDPFIYLAGSLLLVY